MPLEQRRIILTQEEFASALRAYRRVTQGVVPEGEILDWQFGGSAFLCLSVRMIYGNNQVAAKLDYDEAVALDIAIRFCLENNIPIPLQGKKKAIVVDGRLALEILLSDHTDPAPHGDTVHRLR